jgi:hypothetical protein
LAKIPKLFKHPRHPECERYCDHGGTMPFMRE